MVSAVHTQIYNIYYKYFFYLSSYYVCCVYVYTVSSDHCYLCAKIKFIAHSRTCSPFPLHPPLDQAAPGADVIISKRPQQEAHILACQKNVFCLADLGGCCSHSLASSWPLHHVLPTFQGSGQGLSFLFRDKYNYYNSQRSLLTTLHTDGVDKSPGTHHCLIFFIFAVASYIAFITSNSTAG